MSHPVLYTAIGILAFAYACHIGRRIWWTATYEGDRWKA